MTDRSGGSGSPIPAGRARLAFWVLAGLYFLVYFQRQAPAVLALDIKRDIGLTGSGLGLMTAVFFYTYAALQLPAGFISRAWGPGRVLCLFFTLAGLATLAFGRVETLYQALACRVAVGLGVALVLVPMLDILGRLFPPDRFARLVSLVLAVGGLGVFAGAAPLAELDALIGWRLSFVVIGGISLVLAGLAWPLVRGVGAPTKKLVEQAPGSRSTGWLATVRSVFGEPGFWPPALWSFFALGVFISFGGLWGGPYLIHVLGLTKPETGRVLSLLAVGMIIGSPALAVAADSLFKSRKRVLVGCGAVLTGLTLALALFPTGFRPVWMAVWFFGLGLTTMAAMPLALINARNRFPDEVSGVVTGLINFFSIIGGAVLQPVVGLVLDAGSGGAEAYTAAHFGRVFWLYAVCAAAALAAALLISRRPKQVE